MKKALAILLLLAGSILSASAQQTAFDNFDSFNVLASATATGIQTSTTLQDTSQAWTVNAYSSGYYVTILSGTGAGQQRLITANTTNTLTVTAAWTTTPVAGSSVYKVAQMPTGWTPHNSASPFFLTDTTNAISTPNSMGLPGQVANGTAQNVAAVRTASTQSADGAVQFSQKLDISGTTGVFINPVARSDSSSNKSLNPRSDLISGNTFFIDGYGTSKLSATMPLGITFTNGQTVTQKFETQAGSNSAGVYIAQRLKVWLSSNPEPTTWNVVWNDFGGAVTSNGTGSYAAGPAVSLTTPGVGTGAFFWGHISAGGVLDNVLIDQSGYGYTPLTAYGLTISGGALTGTITATATTDAYGAFISTNITAGGTGGNPSPVVTISGGGGTGGGLVQVAVNSAGNLKAPTVITGGNYTSAPTLSVSNTGTGTGGTITVTYDTTGAKLGGGSNGYRGVISNAASGGYYKDPFLDNYYEGAVGTTFGGGQTIATNATGVTYSKANWNVNSSNAIAVNMGAWVKFSFTGTSILTNFSQSASGAVAGWSIDGGPTNTTVLSAGNSTVSMASSLTNTTHSIFLWYEALGGAGDRWNVPTYAFNISSFSIDTGATISAPTLLPKLAFFHGDSTCEGTIAGNTGSSSHIATWARKVARGLNAEYSMMCFAGSGFGGPSPANVPGLTSSYQSVYSGVTRMSGAVFAVQPDYIFILDGVNDGGNIVQDLLTTYTNLRTAAPSAWIFQIVPLGGQNSNYLRGTQIAGSVTSSTSTTLVVAGNVFSATYVGGQYLSVTAISSGGVQQQRFISPGGSSFSAGATTIPITAAWTTNPDSTYTYFVETPYENYQRVHPTDTKLKQIFVGTEYAKGLLGSGPATFFSGDGLHPNWLGQGDVAIPIATQAYGYLNPSTGTGATGFAFP